MLYILSQAVRRMFHHRLTTMGEITEALQLVMGIFCYVQYVVVWGKKDLKTTWTDAAPVETVFMTVFNVSFLVFFVISILMKKAKRSFHLAFIIFKPLFLCDIISTSSALLGCLGYSSTLLHLGVLRFPIVLQAADRVLSNPHIVRVLFCTGRNGSVTKRRGGSITQVRRKIVSILISIAIVIVSFSLIVFMFEALGNPQWITESSFFIREKQFDQTLPLSVFESIYFLFVTVTTVGYGDFSCTTALGRATVVFIMLAGIVFVANATENVISLVRKIRRGEGSFTNRMRRPFVLVLGCGTSTSLLKSFVRQLDRHADDRDRSRMTIIVMHDDNVFSETLFEWSRSIHYKLKCFRVLYLKGSAMSKTDMLNRVNVKSPYMRGTQYDPTSCTYTRTNHVHDYDEQRRCLHHR